MSTQDNDQHSNPHNGKISLSHGVAAWWFGSRGLNTWMLLLVPLIVAAVFWPAIHNGFVWDDWGYLFNVEYSTTEHWVQALTQPLLSFPNYYRPLPVASFIAEIHLRGGHDPGGMHFTNVVLHAFNAALVTALAFRLGRHRGASVNYALAAAIVAGTMYGCHPALVEVTAWISGRFDLLLTLFLLLALLANTLESHPIARPILVGTAFFAAALTKEMAVIFPFVLVAWNMAWTPQPILPLRALLSNTKKRGELAVYLSIILAGLLYLILRHWSLGNIYTQSAVSFAGAHASFLQKILFSAEALARYLFLAINPYSGISVVHPHPYPVPFDDLIAWASLTLIMVLLITLIFLIRRHPSTGWLWTMLPIALLPVIHILGIPIGDNIIHDRYLTYPLTLYALAITPLLIWLFRADSFPIAKQHIVKRAFMALIVILLIANIVNVRITIPLWRDDLSLWTWGSTHSPDSMFALSNLGSVYFENKQYPKALELGLKTAKLRPEFYAGYRLAGKALLELGEKQDGLAFLQLAVARLGATPSAETYIDLADAYMQLGQYKKAEEILLPLSTKEPMNRNLNLLLGIYYSRLGDHVLADQAFEKSQLFYTTEVQTARKKMYDEVLASNKYPKLTAKQQPPQRTPP